MKNNKGFIVMIIIFLMSSLMISIAILILLYIEQTNDISILEEQLSAPLIPIECEVAPIIEKEEIVVATSTIDCDYSKLQDEVDYCWSLKAQDTSHADLLTCKTDLAETETLLRKSEINAMGLLEGRDTCREELDNCGDDKEVLKAKCPFN